MEVDFGLLVGNVLSVVKIFAWAIPSLGVTLPIPLKNELEVAPNGAELGIALRKGTVSESSSIVRAWAGGIANLSAIRVDKNAIRVLFARPPLPLGYWSRPACGILHISTVTGFFWLNKEEPGLSAAIPLSKE